VFGRNDLELDSGFSFVFEYDNNNKKKLLRQVSHALPNIQDYGLTKCMLISNYQNYQSAPVSIINTRVYLGSN
jgi:hypothetical protein